MKTLRRLAVNPLFWQWVHGLSILHWAVLFIPGIIWWRSSVPFLMYISLMTALMTSMAGYGGALAARKADPDDPL